MTRASYDTAMRFKTLGSQNPSTRINTARAFLDRRVVLEVRDLPGFTLDGLVVSVAELPLAGASASAVIVIRTEGRGDKAVSLATVKRLKTID